MIDSIKLIFISFISFITSFLPFNQVPVVNHVSPVASPSSESKINKNNNPVIVKVNGDKFSAYYSEINEVKDLELYTNFEQKQTSAEIINLRKCKALFNGSFYSKNNEPIGLFVSNSKKLMAATFNSLLNGFLSINYDNIPAIKDSPPRNSGRWAIQSGPLIFENKQPNHLRIKNDELARRVVAAMTTDNKLIFIAFYDPENNLQGPYLAYLPQYVLEFKLMTGIKIKDAINLDGGTASAFFANNFFLPEFNPIGSYFCFK